MAKMCSFPMQTGEKREREKENKRDYWIVIFNVINLCAIKIGVNPLSVFSLFRVLTFKKNV